MSETYLIGIDIGTQGTKTTLFDAEGSPLAESFEASRLITPATGIVEQIPDEIYASVMRTIKDVMEKSGIHPGRIAGIGLDGQMAGILGIDANWNAVTHYDSWLDTRCEAYIKKIKAEAEEPVIQTTGCPVTYAHGPKILWWKHERPDTYKKISKFILPTTYVAGRMAGLKSHQAYIDYTHLHFSGFGDVYRQTWSSDLLNHFEVDVGKMPEIVEPWMVTGKLTQQAADSCGLMKGTPVTAGCGDQAATSLGAGVTANGLAFDVAGTASVFSCCVDRYSPDVKYKTLVYPRSVIPGLWIPMAYINGGGLCIKWFRDNLTGESRVSYADLDKEAEAIPCGSNGLIFIPHFSGRVCPNNPNIRGSWIGLNWPHTRAHMYRAVMEGIAYEYSYYMKILKELLGDASFEHVISVGGGAKSKLFNSIKADVLGISYMSPQRSDTATLGSAVVAGFGVGVFDDMAATIGKINKKAAAIQFDTEKYIAYKKYIPVYEGLFPALENTFMQLNAQ